MYNKELCPKLVVEVLDTTRKMDTLDYIDVPGDMMKMEGLEDFLSRMVHDFRNQVEEYAEKFWIDKDKANDLRQIIDIVEEFNKGYFKLQVRA